ncbi:DUF1611 domain-containing protein [Parasphingopyxis sp.]|uniref:DUF1611 domain-containing protein n=1 Tax=Parasphingopyxis sp. TaxID=1920299 RepID=UPI0026048A22|nr:DUF1611 domain-containing protein [Parasphingopyxis sp.]
MLRKPYLAFLGDAPSSVTAKTALGVRQWCPDDIVGQWSLPGCGIDLDLPEMTPGQARADGAASLLIGVAPRGGKLPESWRAHLVTAVEAGLDIVSGLHDRLSDIPELAEAAARTGRALHDVRHNDRSFAIASGRKRAGKRLLTVGTDCALGKKYTALAIAQAMQKRAMLADFRATGQTGIIIAGEGIAMDTVGADFLSGAAEALTPDAADDHWDIIEGQGSLFHPAYAPVTLGLVHGSQPDAIILCHDPARAAVTGFPDYPLPSLAEAAKAYVCAARLTNPAARIVAVSLNTLELSDEAARQAASDAETELGVPCFDPLRFGIDAAIDAIAAL